MEIKKSYTVERVQPRVAYVAFFQPWTDTQVDLPDAHSSRCGGINHFMKSLVEEIQHHGPNFYLH